jgi:hypothetical protein
MRDKVNSETAFWHSLQDLSASRENDMIARNPNCHSKHK